MFQDEASLMGFIILHEKLTITDYNNYIQITLMEMNQKKCNTKAKIVTHATGMFLSNAVSYLIHQHIFNT